MIIHGILFSDIKSSLLLSLSALFYILGDIIMYQINIKELKSILRTYLYFNILLMVADLMYRVYNVQSGKVQAVISNQIYQFYLYKETGLLHMDANGSGFIISAILSVLVYLKSVYSDKLYKVMYIIFFIMLILTFSRASIVGHICLLLVIHLFVRRNVYIKILIGVIAIFSTIPLITLLLNSIDDWSFFTKLVIFSETIEYVKKANITQLLLGNGNGGSEKFLTFGAHNFISAYLIDTGLISLILHIFTCILVGIEMKSKWYILLVPYFLISLSYTPLVVPYIFIAALIIKHMNLKRRKSLC